MRKKNKRSEIEKSRNRQTKKKGLGKSGKKVFKRRRKKNKNIRQGNPETKT